MSDLQKIVVLCIIGLLLVGIFFYTILLREPEQTPAEPEAAVENGEDAEQTVPRSTTTEPESAEEEPRDASAPPTTTSDAPSDAGMEFPILEDPDDRAGQN